MIDLPLAEYQDVTDGFGEFIKRQWSATAYGLTATYTTTDPELQLYEDRIANMREVGVALVDETRTMRVNRRRDRRGNE